MSNPSASDDKSIRRIGIMGNSADHVALNLFVIAPNNSGSTLLRTALATSPNVWSLEREGQHIPGFTGPSTRGTGLRLIWASSEQRLSHFQGEAGYDWARNKLLWYSAAQGAAQSARIFVTSSPPFLFQMQALSDVFNPAQFILLIRDPYAAAEGIIRRASQQPLYPDENIVDAAARHVAACFRQQAENRRLYPDAAMTLTYEDLCDHPEESAARISDFAPALSALDFNRSFSVKDKLSRKISNHNEAQISRLTRAQILRLTAIFRQAKPQIQSFGYALREA